MYFGMFPLVVGLYIAYRDNLGVFNLCLSRAET